MEEVDLKDLVVEQVKIASVRGVIKTTLEERRENFWLRSKLRLIPHQRTLVTEARVLLLLLTS